MLKSFTRLSLAASKTVNSRNILLENLLHNARRESPMLYCDVFDKRRIKINEITLVKDYSTSVEPIPKKPTVAEIFVNQFPTSVIPYLKIMRIDRPIGSWLLFWPCAWSTALATPAGCLPDLYYLTLFGVGSFVMRGAGCTINDLWDKDIDAKVSRTKDRPLACGTVETKKAILFLGGQLSIGLLVLLQFNLYTQILATSSLGLVTIYPLMKRITYWPQLVLGLTFNWGALVGWSAVHGSCYWPACLSLYAAGVCWTIVYDTIYAHQDKLDDTALGLKSTALKFGEDTKWWLASFATLMTSSLVTGGIICDQTWPYYASLALVSSHIAYQIFNLNINNPADCAKKFLSNKHVGLILFLGIVLGNLAKPTEEGDQRQREAELALDDK